MRVGGDTLSGVNFIVIEPDDAEVTLLHVVYFAWTRYNCLLPGANNTLLMQIVLPGDDHVTMFDASKNIDQKYTSMPFLEYAATIKEEE